MGEVTDSDFTNFIDANTLPRGPICNEAAQSANPSPQEVGTGWLRPQWD
jgi:hypothetical protein